MGGGEAGEWSPGIHSLLRPGGNLCKLAVVPADQRYGSFLSFRAHHFCPGLWGVSHTLVTSLRILPHPWWWRAHSFTQNYSQMTEPPVFCWNPDTPARVRHCVRCSVQRWRTKMMENKQQLPLTESFLFARDGAKVFFVYYLIQSSQPFQGGIIILILQIKSQRM